MTVTFDVTDGSGSGVYNHGAKVNIVAYTPNEGSYFSHWHSDCTLGNANSASTTATMPTSILIIDAYAAAQYSLYTYQLNYSAGTGGSISGDDSQTVNWGTDGTEVEAVPNANYHFVRWSDGTSTAKRHEHNVKSNQSYTATFAPNITYYSLTVINGTGDGAYGSGTQVAIAADSPASGYEFDVWTGNTTGIDNLYAASTHIHTQAQNATITATYKVNSHIKKIMGEVILDVKEIEDVNRVSYKKIASVDNNNP